MLKINNVEFEFDIYDVDNSERFEEAIEKLSESEEAVKKATETQKMSVVNKAFIGMFKQFFINATGVDVLADCKNSKTAEEAYSEFLDEIGKMKGQLLTKYDTKRVR
jgi:hypothetical protein